MLSKYLLGALIASFSVHEFGLIPTLIPMAIISLIDEVFLLNDIYMEKKLLNKVSEADDMSLKHKEQAEGMCECGHTSIEHHSHAKLIEEAFTTDVKECHMCECEQFALKQEDLE